MPNLYTSLKNLISVFETDNQKFSAALQEAKDALDLCAYGGDETELHHLSDEEALDTIDAKMFTGDQTEEELQRIEYFCTRWLRRCEESRKSMHELEEENRRLKQAGEPDMMQLSRALDVVQKGLDDGYPETAMVKAFNYLRDCTK